MVQHTTYYEEQEPNLETVRPFRIWDSQNKVEVRWRYYTDGERAKNYAIVAIRTSSIGVTLEVYDCSTGKWLATYRRRVHDIMIDEPKETHK